MYQKSLSTYEEQYLQKLKDKLNFPEEAAIDLANGESEFFSRISSSQYLHYLTYPLSQMGRDTAVKQHIKEVISRFHLVCLLFVVTLLLLKRHDTDI